MKEVSRYLQEYYKCIDKKLFFIVSFFLAIIIFLNYYFRLYLVLYAPESFFSRFLGFFLLFAFVFSVSYLLTFWVQRKALPATPFFYILIVLAPVIFAIKIAFAPSITYFSLRFAYPWDHYLRLVSQWPLKGLFACGLAYLLWRTGNYGKPVAGLSSKKISLRPYFILLAAMIPLVVIAAMTSDFQRVYPKLQHIDFISGHTIHAWLFKLFFELSYGLDFFTIEFFFRGFLILAFIRFAGKDAILPMAVFYCTIHFGKPLAECISSYFGGIILGVIVYRTQSIWGGLIVHLGIAWLMEITGYFL